MLGVLIDIFSGICTFLTGHLPLSPFANITLPEGMHDMLGWLNWIVPVGDMLTLFGLVLAAYVVARTTVWLINSGVEIGQAVTS